MVKKPVGSNLYSQNQNFNISLKSRLCQATQVFHIFLTLAKYLVQFLVVKCLVSYRIGAFPLSIYFCRNLLLAQTLIFI
jgi:uncharacterized membrane protein